MSDAKKMAEEWLNNPRYDPDRYDKTEDIICTLLAELEEAEKGWQDCADDYQSIGRELAAAQDQISALTAERDRLKEQYNELIMAVANKYPDESRHETTLKYICWAQRPTTTTSMTAPPETKEGK